jgi:hypothetical protein
LLQSVFEDADNHLSNEIKMRTWPPDVECIEDIDYAVDTARADAF